MFRGNVDIRKQVATATFVHDMRRGNDGTMLYLISLFKGALICLHRVIYFFVYALFCVKMLSSPNLPLLLFN